MLFFFLSILYLFKYLLKFPSQIILYHHCDDLQEVRETTSPVLSLRYTFDKANLIEHGTKSTETI